MVPSINSHKTGRRPAAGSETDTESFDIFEDSLQKSICSVELSVPAKCGALKKVLRGPAPKKRPMVFGSKIESADFYLPSRGYRILFKNEFPLFLFRCKLKISSRKLFPSDTCKIRLK